MYAIVETGGKQYQVEEGRYVDVELLNQEADSKVVFENIVMIVNGKKSKVGQPYVAGASVEGFHHRKYTAPYLQKKPLKKLSTIIIVNMEIPNDSFYKRKVCPSRYNRFSRTLERELYPNERCSRAPRNFFKIY